MRVAPGYRPMTAADLDAVMAIEQAAYPFPWTRGNFEDCLDAGYDCEVLCVAGRPVAYRVAARMVDEIHVLNCCVAPALQGRGLGTAFMRRLMERLPQPGVSGILLEVRESNLAARHLYAKLGFREIGCRKGYYPAADGHEDARVLRWTP